MKAFSFILLFLCTIYCNAQNTVLHKGNKAYQEGDFEKAKEAYLRALQAENKDDFDKIYYNLGNVFFKNNLFEQAEKSFDNTVTTTKDSSLKAKAYYNIGLALIRQNKIEEAIIAFKNALRLYPDDNDARDNLQKALNTLPKQKNSKQTKPAPSPNKQQLSAQQAQQLLDKLHQKEMQLQKQLQKQKSTGKPVEKDW